MLQYIRQRLYNILEEPVVKDAFLNFRSSFSSKLSGVAYQLISLPIAFRVLSHDQYAAFLILSGMMQSFSLVGAVFSYGLIKKSAICISKNVRDQLYKDINICISLTVFLSIVFCIIGIIFFLPFFHSLTNNRSSVSTFDILFSTICIYFVSQIGLIFTIFENVQIGFQKMYDFNRMSTVANILTFFSFFLVPYFPTVFAFASCSIFIRFFCRAFNIFRFVKTMEEFSVDIHRPMITSFKSYFSDSFLYFGIQVGYYLSSTFILFLLNAFNKTSELVLFSVSLQIVTMVTGIPSILSTGIIPHVTAFVELGNRSMIVKCKKIMEIFFLIYWFVSSILLLFFQRDIARYMFNDITSTSSHFFLLCCLLNLINMIENLYWSFLLPLSKFQYVCVSILGKGIIIGVIGLFFEKNLGFFNIIIVNIIVSVPFSFVLLPFITRKTLAQNSV